MQNNSIKFAALKAGGAVLLYLALANLFSVIVYSLMNLFLGNGFLHALSPQMTYEMTVCADILITVISTGIPVLVFCGSDPVWRAETLDRNIGRLALPAFFAVFCVGNLVSNMFANFAATLGWSWSSADLTGAWDSTVSVALTLLRFAVIPAVFEELLFRGAVMKSLSPYGERTAVLVSAILFTCMHNNPTTWPAIFLLGVLFAFVDLRTGSLLPSMLLHLLNNSIAMASEYLAYAKNTYAISIFVTVLFALGVMFLIQLAASVRSIAPSLKLSRGERPMWRAIVSPAVLLCFCYTVFAVIVTAVKV